MSANLGKDAKWEASITGFLQRQWFTHGKPFDDSIRLADRVAIVTGSNCGLGFETARQLCHLGLGRLIMAVRSQSRGDEAAEKLRKEFPKTTTIEVWILDMNSYDSVIAFARRCESLPRIDITLLNAAIQMRNFEKNPVTGHEIDLQVNYISTALLAILLLPVLRRKKAPAGPTPILSLVASDTAFWVQLEEPAGPVFASMDNPAEFSLFGHYSKSKLLVIIFVAALAARVNSSDVIVNAVNPGLTRGTLLTRQSQSWARFVVIGAMKRFIGRSVTSGASAIVDAVLVEGPKSHGSYVSDWAVRP